jgi:Tfp pilus assembly protein PilF
MHSSPTLHSESFLSPDGLHGQAQRAKRGQRWRLPVFFSLLFALPACAQDRSEMETEFRGSGAEISVTVREVSGEQVSTSVIVRLLRNGSLPVAQQETSRGNVLFIVKSLGEFTVTVEGSGYAPAQKDISIHATGSAHLDISLRLASKETAQSGIPGRALLTPKAKKAVEKSLQAIVGGKTEDAEKYENEAKRLAPGHPDVLYVAGVIALKKRKWAEAETALEEATNLDPSMGPAFAALGMTLCDEGKFDAAIGPLEKAVQVGTTSTWEARWALAKAYYQRQRYEEALKMSQQALADSNGKAPEIALLVAQSLTAVGRYDDAALQLNGFLREHSELHQAATARRWLDGLVSDGKLSAAKR